MYSLHSRVLEIFDSVFHLEDVGLHYLKANLKIRIREKSGGIRKKEDSPAVLPAG